MSTNRSLISSAISRPATRNLELPIELLQLILSYLAVDLATIKSCALVCRSWLPDARRILFHSIKVDECTSYKETLAIFKASPDIRSCVKRLDLKILNSYARIWSRSVDDLISFVLDHAPESLQSLKVEVYCIDLEPDQELMDALVEYVSRLRELKTFIAHVPVLTRPSHRPFWLHKILPNLSPSILSIVIEVPADGVGVSPDSEELINWNAIDEVITPARFSLLRNVSLIVKIHDGYPVELRELVQAQLSELELFKHGILDIEFREPVEPEFSSVVGIRPVDEGQLRSRQGCFSGCTVQ